MNCDFNPMLCKNCARYGNCLLQVVYANTLALADMIKSLSDKVDNIKIPSFVPDDFVEMFSTFSTIDDKLNTISKALENNEDLNNERTVDIDNMQSSLSAINTKLDDLIKSYNSYEYIPIIDKE